MLPKLSQASGVEEGAFLSLEVLGLWHLFCKDEEAPGWSLERVLVYAWRGGARAAAAGPFRVPFFASCFGDNAL